MSQKQKISAEEKAEVVRAYLSEEIGRSEAARRIGVTESSIARWARNYEADGIDAFLPHKNRIYSVALKQQAVKAYLSGSGSLSDICKKYHIRHIEQLRRWIKVYNGHGDFNSVKYSGGGSYMKQGRETTQEERIQIAKESLVSGKNYGEIAIKYNVSYQQVQSWTPRYEELGEAGLEDRRGKRKKDQQPRTELEKAGMTQSMSHVARCIDNGPMEGFWGILKRECYYNKRFTSKSELIQTIQYYVSYYNNCRVQRNLGILTPMEKYNRYLVA